MYHHGDTVLITNIGDSEADPGSSLACVTSNVNTQCCSGSAFGNVGNWYFPSGTIVPRNSAAPSADFTRSGFTHQVRLNRRNNAMSPTGTYECRIPVSAQADVTALITVGKQTVLLLVWPLFAGFQFLIREGRRAGQYRIKSVPLLVLHFRVSPIVVGSKACTHAQ